MAGRASKKTSLRHTFIQTQLNYDMNIVRQYSKILVDQGGLRNICFFLIGNGPLPSAKSAIWMRDNLWGVVVPDDIIHRLDQAKDPKEEGIQICAQQIQEMAEMPGVAGVHDGARKCSGHPRPLSGLIWHVHNDR